MAHTGVVYTRTVKGEELTFGVSGKLYKDALVLYDRQTHSLWTQVDGRVLRGPLRGATLRPLPALQTTWGEWKRLHPDTLVLKKERSLEGSPLADYFSNPEQLGIAGTQNPDQRLPGKALVVTLREGSDALAISLQTLEKNLLSETVVGGVPVVVVYTPGSGTARAFDRRVGGETLDFVVEREEEGISLRDRTTGSRWSTLTGAALEGPLAGERLRAIPHMVNYWFAWVAYNPRTRLEP